MRASRSGLACKPNRGPANEESVGAIHLVDLLRSFQRLREVIEQIVPILESD
jgi:hypothetical protein